MTKEHIIVLDLKTARSAEDCRHCGQPESRHHTDKTCITGNYNTQLFDPIGWDNKSALGQSIGGYYSYMDDRIHWFDEHCLEDVIACLVDVKPLMVSFNGIAFDFPLMRGILRRKAEHLADHDRIVLNGMCDAFKCLAAVSYDILAEIWRADPTPKFERGLNSLDAIAQANGLGPKLSHGAQAPRDWAAGRCADVIDYCQDNILKTKTLFERLTFWQGQLTRGDGNTVNIRWIDNNNQWQEAENP